MGVHKTPVSAEKPTAYQVQVRRVSPHTLPFHRSAEYHVLPLGASASHCCASVSRTKENRPIRHSVQLHRLQAAGRLKEKLAHSRSEQHCPSSHSDVTAGRSNGKSVRQYGRPRDTARWECDCCLWLELRRLM